MERSKENLDVERRDELTIDMTDARIELTWQRLRRASLCGPFHTSRPNIPAGTRSGEVNRFTYLSSSFFASTCPTFPIVPPPFKRLKRMFSKNA